jgi:hypothetical protein
MPKPEPASTSDQLIAAAVEACRDEGRVEMARALAYLSRIAGDEYLLKMVRRRLGQLRDGLVMVESGRN